jgi:hypothetical protein
MPYVTSAMTDAAKAVSYSFQDYEDALHKAMELADQGVEGVSVTDIDTGEVLSGEELLAAIEAMAASEDGPAS